MKEVEVREFTNYDDLCLTGLERTLKLQSEYPDDYVLLAARTAHSVMQCISEAIGEPVLPAWEQTATWYRASFTKQVENVLYYGARTRSSHNKWVNRMKRRGWTQKDGPVDRVNKTHPYLMEYNDLPGWVKLKQKSLRAAVMPFKHNSSGNPETEYGHNISDIAE